MTQDLQSIFDALMNLGTVDGQPDDVAMAHAGSRIEVVTDLGREDGIARALTWCDALAKRALSDTDAALLEYFRANAWAARHRQRNRDREALWNWDQPELQQQILHLRRAMRHPGYPKLDAIRQCQIQTNLRN